MVGGTAQGPTSSKRVAGERIQEMKQCPDCSTRNQMTNIFCPTCGHSFLDDPPPGRSWNSRLRNIVPGRDTRRLSLIIAIVIIVVLGLTAGLTSYFVSHEIDRSSMVPVKSGVRWKCEKCGKIYKDRVATLTVRKSQKVDYGVATVAGLCDGCKYGAMVGSYQDMLEYLTKKGYFHGFGIDISDEVASFMRDNPSLFPAADQSHLPEIASAVDPRAVERDFSAYVGKPVALRAKVEGAHVINVHGGRTVTYLQMQPIWNEAPVNLEFLAIYDGVIQVGKGATVGCYLLPADIVAYKSVQGDRKAVLCLAMGLNVEKY